MATQQFCPHCRTFHIGGSCPREVKGRNDALMSEMTRRADDAERANIAKYEASHPRH